MKKLLIIFSFVFIAACGGKTAGQVSVPGVEKNSKEAAEFLDAVKGKAIVPLRSARGFPVGYFKDNGDIASRYHHPILQGDLIFIGMTNNYAIYSRKRQETANEYADEYTAITLSEDKTLIRIYLESSDYSSEISKWRREGANWDNYPKMEISDLGFEDREYTKDDYIYKITDDEYDENDFINK
ncbi:hypothetical protein A966_02193 [Brachyspira hampsonii 30446]|uniref:Lipoprotein n=1 Tax=Brachyspira hampsonii 30446 TaxID=1289135 RepID=A0A2U4F1B2_9SPIR|nr:hypothetical protein [Brachyspira hampsonii]EKV58092.1 hypothetical protein A966_02193 [Brachyspira hampsonii 30446]MBW5395076.1 hypothetical protein [Brachyspira hampsonii]OEJ19419.1 hypothetical protein A9495_04560 [Brachyspira hampsonii]